MAITVTKVTTRGRSADGVQGNHKIVYRDVTFDTSYPTGGESITAASLGLSTIVHVAEATAKNAAGTLSIPLRWDYTNNKIQAFHYNGAAAGLAFLQEVANATDLSLYSVRLRFEGFPASS